MIDVIWGDVIRVVDGDTFDIKVTHYGSNNRLKYNNFERIRMAETDVPELRWVSGWRAKQDLEKWLSSKRVYCEIQARDIYRRLVCKISLLS